MWTSDRLTLTGAPVSTSFGLTWVDGTGCPTTSGLLTGNCLSLNGRGAINGRTYYFKSTGTTVTFSGGFEGVLELYREEPIPCNGGANTFRLVGALTAS
jgi:hypothetical protein